MARLPRIQCYARRPIFNNEFVLLGPGWHPNSGVLVHGPTVEPVLRDAGDPARDPLDRLPPNLRMLLQNVCFWSAADLANAIGLMLTGVLINHFIDQPPPVAILDGNQPGVGKTLLARVVGIVLGAIDPQLIH